MKKTRRSKGWYALLILGMLLGTATTLSAATGYEVSGVTFSQTVTAQQFVRVTEDLTVSWTAPSGTDPVLNYFIKLNTSSTALTGTALDDTTNDFAVTKDYGFKTIPVSTFAAYDSNQLRYLHIRTQYLSSTTGTIAYSDDVVTGPIRIDNVSPTGTITLNPTSGSSKQVTVTMSPSESITSYWLNDVSSFPGGTGTDYSTFPSGTVGLRDGTAYGNVTIYAWFQDVAGNRSTAASASAVYNYTAPVAIQYTSSSINVDGQLVFTVDETTSYTWTITDPSVSGVAEISGSATGTSVTVVGKKAGTFTVTAISGSTTLKTNTITVVQTTTSKKYSLIYNANSTSVNAIVLSRAGTGYTTASELFAAVPDCNDLSRWSAADQGYESYIPGANDFALVVGEPYFVSVSKGGDFTVTGSVPTISYTLKTTNTTSVNAISLPQSKSTLLTASQLFDSVPSCNDLSRWSAADQGYESYIPGANDFSLAVDEAYFVSVAVDNTKWP